VPDWLAVNEALPSRPVLVPMVSVPLLTVGILGKVTRLPAPLIYCEPLPAIVIARVPDVVTAEPVLNAFPAWDIPTLVTVPCGTPPTTAST